MQLYVFDRQLNMIGILDIFTSLRWIRRYSKYGEFELHCDLTTENLELLKKENIIWKSDDNEAGYVEYRNLKQDISGKELLVIKGRFLTGYLNRRIIWSTETLNLTVENATRTLITRNCITPTNLNRIIPNLILGDLKNYTELVNYQVSYKNLLDELENLGNSNNLGYRVKFDVENKKLVFDVYKGREKTINQSIIPPCIFCKEFENILEHEFTDSINNYRNVALIGGVGEGSARKMTTIGDSVGLDRFELFVDAKDVSNSVYNGTTSTTISDTDYTNLLIDRGNNKLAETKEVQTFDSKINVNSNLVYKTDYDLGDIVTCTSKKWGITINSRITEIEEIYEEKGVSINITFGNNVPTLIDKIKQIVR